MPALRFALPLMLLVLVHACGGDDSTVDATPPIDTPPPLPDACVEYQACTGTTCDDVSGSYVTCAVCPVVGTVGPYATTVSQCECSVEGCVDGQCGTGCVDGNTVTYQAMVEGVTLTCTGTVTAGTGDFNCTSTLGNCTATWLPASTTVCP